MSVKQEDDRIQYNSDIKVIPRNKIEHKIFVKLSNKKNWSPGLFTRY